MKMIRRLFQRHVDTWKRYFTPRVVKVLEHRIEFQPLVIWADEWYYHQPPRWAMAGKVLIHDEDGVNEYDFDFPLSIYV
jgi:hypothetical protein